MIVGGMPTTISSDAVTGVLDWLHAKAAREDQNARQRVLAREAESGVRLTAPQRYEIYGDAPLAIIPKVGQLYDALARTRRATTIVEFGASHGISTIYLAAALRDCGGARVITTEILPGKADKTRRNLTDAGLADLVEVRVGDALETLNDLSCDVDVLVLDGRNDQYLAVLGLVEEHLAPHAPVLADLGINDPDLIAYQRHVRASDSSYVSMELPLDAGIELSVYTPTEPR